MILIVICTFGYWFGPAIATTLGSFLGGIITALILIISFPVSLLLTRKDRKNSDNLYERLQIVKQEGNDYLLECSLTEQLEESRKKVGIKMQIIVASHIVAITAVVLYFYILG